METTKVPELDRNAPPFSPNEAFSLQSDRLRLTDAEREAVAWSINDQIEGGHQEHPVVKEVIATLRGLLERTK